MKEIKLALVDLHDAYDHYKHINKAVCTLDSYIPNNIINEHISSPFSLDEVPQSIKDIKFGISAGKDFFQN